MLSLESPASQAYPLTQVSFSLAWRQLERDVRVQVLLDQVLIMKLFMKSRRGSGVSGLRVAYVPAVKRFEGEIDDGPMAFLCSERLRSAARALVCLFLNDNGRLPAFRGLGSCGGSGYLPACSDSCRRARGVGMSLGPGDGKCTAPFPASRCHIKKKKN